MKTIRKCAFCGKEFVARSGMQKYCSEQCQTKAKEARKKKQRDFINAVEPVIDVQSQEYLTFSKAAILMGCSRQYIYKLVMKANWQHHASVQEWHSSARQTSNKCLPAIPITVSFPLPSLRRQKLHLPFRQKKR